MTTASAISNRPVRALVSLLGEAPPHQLVTLLVLLTLSSLTEGVGLVMLAPMLAALSNGGADTALGGALSGAGFGGSVGVLLATFIGLIALRAGLVHAHTMLTLRLETGVIDRIRQRCFDGLLDAEWRWLVQTRASDHASLLISGIGRINVGLKSAISLVATGALALAYVAAGLLLSWQFALTALACGIVLHLLVLARRERALRLGHDLGVAHRGVHAAIQDALDGVRLIKILRREAAHKAQLTGITHALRANQLSHARDTSISLALAQLAGATILALLVYVSMTYWRVGVAELLPLLLVISRLMPMTAALQRHWHNWLHAVPAVEEAYHLSDRTAQVAETASDPETSPLRLTRQIVLDDVSLRHPGRTIPALDHLSITLPAGAITAITGRSGAGKSSLADLLMGLIEPDSGVLRVDGAPVNGADRQRWRASVAYVQQDAVLFHGSIKDNLLLAAPAATDQDLINALRRAAANFVFDLPKRLDTVVGDGGARLSGGERQRIALARALLGQPDLLILDEATSALDPENEIAILQTILSWRGDLTIVVIGHRLPMLDQMDQVIRLDQGRIAAAA